MLKPDLSEKKIREENLAPNVSIRSVGETFHPRNRVMLEFFFSTGELGLRLIFDKAL